MADRDEIDYNNLEKWEYVTQNLPNGDIKYFKQLVRINPMDSLEWPRGVFSQTVLESTQITKEEYDQFNKNNRS